MPSLASCSIGDEAATLCFNTDALVVMVVVMMVLMMMM